MDLSKLTDAERQAAEEAVIKLRESKAPRIVPDGSFAYGCTMSSRIIRGEEVLALVVQEQDAIAMLAGLKMMELSDAEVLALANKVKLLNPNGSSRLLSSANHLPHVVALVNELRNLGPGGR